MIKPMKEVNGKWGGGGEGREARDAECEMGRGDEE